MNIFDTTSNSINRKVSHDFHYMPQPSQASSISKQTPRATFGVQATVSAFKPDFKDIDDGLVIPCDTSLSSTEDCNLH
jgi:hypothetical protein